MDTFIILTVVSAILALSAVVVKWSDDQSKAAAEAAAEKVEKARQGSLAELRQQEIIQMFVAKNEIESLRTQLERKTKEVAPNTTDDHGDLSATFTEGLDRSINSALREINEEAVLAVKKRAEDLRKRKEAEQKAEEINRVARAVLVKVRQAVLTTFNAAPKLGFEVVEEMSPYAPEWVKGVYPIPGKIVFVQGDERLRQEFKDFYLFKISSKNGMCAVCKWSPGIVSPENLPDTPPSLVIAAGEGSDPHPWLPAAAHFIFTGETRASGPIISVRYEPSFETKAEIILHLVTAHNDGKLSAEELASKVTIEVLKHLRGMEISELEKKGAR